MFSSGDADEGQASEFNRLRSDIVSEIEWCSEALGECRCCLGALVEWRYLCMANRFQVASQKRSTFG